MKDVSQVTALVVDHGLFLPLAVKLAETYKRVLYYTPWERGFPLIEECVIGDGVGNVERCQDIWSVKDEVDLFVFPDIQHAGLQLELESQGKLVWGSRKGDEYELNRQKFLKAIKQVGLDVPPYEKVIGLSELRRVLLEADGPRYVKISRYRGSMETWKHSTILQSLPVLEELAAKLGPLQEHVPFLVFEPIEAFVELGGDHYCVDGRFPSWAVHGIEHKDKSYAGVWQKYSELPNPVQEVNEAFSPLLAAERYRNFWSTEIRVTQDDQYFFIDPCCRCPSPASEAQLEMIGNLAEVVYAGASGELIEPERAFEFGVQAILNVKERNRWNVVEIPEKVRRWVKLKDAVAVDGTYGIKAGNDTAEGWVVGCGNSLKAAVESVKETVSQLDSSAVDVDVSVLASVLQDVQSEEKAGIEFSDKPTPEPAEALRET